MTFRKLFPLLLLGLFLSPINVFSMQDAADDNIFFRFVNNAGNWAGERLDEYNRQRQAERERIERRRENCRTEKARLATEQASCDLNTPAGKLRHSSLQEQMNDLDDEIKRLNKNQDMDEEDYRTMRDLGVGMMKTGSETMKEQALEKIRQQGATQRAMMIFKKAFEPNNLMKIVGVSGGIFALYYTSKLGYGYLEKKLGRPSLVRDSSQAGFMKTLKEMFVGEETIERKLSDVVVSPEIELATKLLAEDIKKNREYGLPYQNALFYGPPGTGKTEFAKTLAYLSGMDYAILSGADFSQFKDGEDIVELHKLFDWAETSENGMLIFIDEADACFRDRATLTKEGVDLVNAFLSRTGCNSDKFMFILATNYEDELDSAVRSRIHKKIPFLLPSLSDRAKILDLKLQKYIMLDQRTYTKDGEEIEATLEMAQDIDQDYLFDVAKRMVGFSGRDIDQAAAAMRLRAYRSGENTLTREIIEYVVSEKIKAIEKDRKATAYQRQRQADKNKSALAAAAAL